MVNPINRSFMPQSRKLAAIMFTDILGYTALMGDDEQNAFEILPKYLILQVQKLANQTLENGLICTSFNFSMIQYERFVLYNGLRVIVHQDHSTPLAVVNVMYDVGARDEDPNKTGFAHLFEHLMFGGSINIPEYDDALQIAGGENNAPIVI